MRRWEPLVLCGWVLLGSPGADAHTRIKPGSTLKPRSTSSAEKTAPCGAAAPTTDPLLRTTLVAGQQFTVSWEETIQHTGYFRIAFSPDGRNGFDSNVLKDRIVDNQDGPTDYASAATYHQFKATITVPSTLCEACALQVIQVMIDNHPQTPTNYYSCADVRIVAGNGSSSPAAAPTTAAAPASPTAPAPEAPQHVQVMLKPAANP